ncbi:MAG: hypothetical protein HeimC3_16380 [Candidatus Heimdallarchaeota archaeon LC_3]|nr:MAG: hypothetical protein HeimC3_16380 [Candidatus Heimdallarchaeota archaeon LC_3]
MSNYLNKKNNLIGVNSIKQLGKTSLQINKFDLTGELTNKFKVKHDLDNLYLHIQFFLYLLNILLCNGKRRFI